MQRQTQGPPVSLPALVGMPRGARIDSLKHLIGGCFVSIVFLGACASGDLPADEPADVPAGPFEINIQADTEGSSAINVKGETNLPDGAIITVSASRSMLEDNETEVRAANLANQEATVQGGTFSTTLALDESDVMVGVGTFEIEQLSNEVTVCAEFRTGEEAFSGEQYQSDQSVVDAVGPYGENLEGSPGVEVFGELTDTPSNWLVAETSVALESPLLIEIADAQGLAPDSVSLEGFCVS